MKVAICIPCYGNPKGPFAEALVEMVSLTERTRIGFNGKPTVPTTTRHWRFGCPRIDLAREQLGEEAMAENPDYLLWLDADHTFPPMTLLRLAAHDQPIVGCNYRRRLGTDEVVSSAMNRVNGVGAPIGAKPDGLEKVDVVGFGVCLIKARVFELMPRPWFSLRDPEVGEDAQFCLRAGEGGLGVYVDHALSREVGHLAETNLRFPG